MPKISITTFNCGKAFPFSKVSQSTPIDNIVKQLIPHRSSNSDIVVLGLQELCDIWQGSFSDVISHYINLIVESVLSHINNSNDDNNNSDTNKYQFVGFNNTGCISMLVFIKNSHYKVEKLHRANCQRGYLGSSLKGAASMVLELKDLNTNEIESFLFICCHLWANEGVDNLKYRIDDFDAILNDSKSKFGSNLFNKSHLFLFGDLNFRSSNAFDPNQSIKKSLLTDELLLNMRNKNKTPIFNGFIEEEITFPPTYKYKLFDIANSYTTKRIASWCDRILYREYPTNENTTLIKYNSIPRTKELLFTDHQPVNLTIQVPRISIDTQVHESSYRQLKNVTTDENLIDNVIGYAGWLMSYNVHIWSIMVFFLLYILYHYY